nr:hypothetical protein [Pedobacter puniceum]
MKANHNSQEQKNINKQVVVNISSSKNESKSQRRQELPEVPPSCCKYQ